MNYPILIHKDPDSDYGVIVPDLPGCFSAGSTIDEAIAMATEAIELHMEGLIEDGQKVPAPRDIEAHQANPEYTGGMWAIAGVDTSNLRVKTKRINITMPERVLDAVDRCAKRRGQSRSDLLAQAAAEFMGRGADKSLPRARRGPRCRPKVSATRKR